MSRFNWINAKEIEFNNFLFLDRWVVKMIIDRDWPGYRENMGIALKYNPAVAWYFANKCPESAAAVAELVKAAPEGLSAAEVRQAEVYIIDACETDIIYAMPELMNSKCDYITDWDSARLFELADFAGKTVLDLGAGTGRLTFAAQPCAAKIYASEPCDRLREFMRDKIAREGITNVVVTDGRVECIPFPDDCFDIVMSGHVVGDDYNTEFREMERVCRDGGYIIDCRGDSKTIEHEDAEMIKRGCEPVFYDTASGGRVYNYRKQVKK